MIFSENWLTNDILKWWSIAPQMLEDWSSSFFPTPSPSWTRLSLSTALGILLGMLGGFEQIMLLGVFNIVCPHYRAYLVLICIFLLLNFFWKVKNWKIQQSLNEICRIYFFPNYLIAKVRRVSRICYHICWHRKYDIK